MTIANFHEKPVLILINMLLNEMMKIPTTKQISSIFQTRARFSNIRLSLVKGFVRGYLPNSDSPHALALSPASKQERAIRDLREVDGISVCVDGFVLPLSSSR